MIGLQRSTVSPCSSSISRSTPCVLGCWGPMLRIIVWSSSGSSGRSPSMAASASLIRSTEPISRNSSRAVTSERGLQLLPGLRRLSDHPGRWTMSVIASQSP